MKLYLKLEGLGLLKLILIFNLPLLLFYIFAPYPLPNIQFVFLGVLVFSQYVIFSEKKYRAKNEERSKKSLSSELNRVPSTSEISLRLIKMFQFHGASVIICGLNIIIIAILFSR